VCQEERADWQRVAKAKMKNKAPLEKNVKNLLTNFQKCDIIITETRERGNGEEPKPT
jgi:hypothetical protein